MKLKRNITATALALSLVAGVALATTSNTDSPSPGNGQGYGMMKGQGAHHGFGGSSWHGKGMRGGANQDCWNENRGSGMGQKGMKRGGSGMQRGAMMNPEMQEKRDAFLNATVDLRKEMHDKRFAYREAKRNPALTVGELQKQEKELYVLRQQVQSKRLEFFKSEKTE